MFEPVAGFTSSSKFTHELDENTWTLPSVNTLLACNAFDKSEDYTSIKDEFVDT